MAVAPRGSPRGLTEPGLQAGWRFLVAINVSASTFTRMQRMPGGEIAEIDLRKLEDFCLDPSHLRGRHKARVFRRALDIGCEDAAWLRSALLAAVSVNAATELSRDCYGARWCVDALVTRHDKAAVVRTLWIVSADEGAPRLITCWVL